MASRARKPAPTEQPATDAPATNVTEGEAVSTATATEAPASVDPTEATTDNGEAAVVTDETAAAAAAAPEPEEVIDLTAIHAAAEAIVNGDLSDLSTIDFTPVITEYNKLSRKGKAAVTREFSAKSKDLLEASDFPKARVYLLAEKATRAAKPAASATRTPADPTEGIVSRLAGFQLAYATLMENLPEGLPEGSTGDALQAKVKAAFDAGKDEVAKLLEWNKSTAEDKGDAPEVSPAAALAAKIAFSPTRKPYGKRHDVTAHIVQVFAGKDANTFMTVGEIAAAKSEEYGDEKASVSAITARITSDKGLPEGLSLVERDGTKGLLKAAA